MENRKSLLFSLRGPSAPHNRLVLQCALLFPVKAFRKGFQEDTDGTKIPQSAWLLPALLEWPARTERNIFPALWSKVLHYHVTKENRLLGS